MGENMITTEYPHGEVERAGVQTVEEFRKKYGGKRFSSKTAPKSLLYSFLYDLYEINENKERTDLYPNMLAIQKQVNTYDDMNTWNAYLALIEWQRSAFNTAVFMRNTLKSSLSDYHHMITSIIAGEQIRRNVVGEQPEAFTLFLHTLTLEAYTPQSDGGQDAVFTLRKNIESALLYMSAYNTFMDILADFTKTPEYTFLKVDMAGSLDALDEVNEALECLRQDVKDHREKEIKEATKEEKGKLWPIGYLRETMKAFAPIGLDLPSVPASKKKEAKDNIKNSFGKYFLSWHKVFATYASEYWRRALG